MNYLCRTCTSFSRFCACAASRCAAYSARCANSRSSSSASRRPCSCSSCARTSLRVWKAPLLLSWRQRPNLTSYQAQV
eukprot:3849998-Pyramimonas_sp.AAC.1